MHNIQRDVREILAEIRRLEGRFMDNANGRNDVLRRHLANTAAYIESVSGGSDTGHEDEPQQPANPDVRDEPALNGGTNHEREDNDSILGDHIIREARHPNERLPQGPPLANYQPQPANPIIQNALHHFERLPQGPPLVNRQPQPANPIILDAVHHFERLPQRVSIVNRQRRPENLTRPRRSHYLRYREQPCICRINSDYPIRPSRQPTRLHHMQGISGLDPTATIAIINTQSSRRMRTYEWRSQTLWSSHSVRETTFVLDRNLRGVAEIEHRVKSTFVMESTECMILEF
jgi:hypothetical protein